jgi:hypothetical protein
VLVAGASDGAADGWGITATAGAAIVGSRLAIIERRAVGVLAIGVATTIALTDAVVRGTQLRADGTFGHGLEASAGARLDALRVLVADNGEVGATGGGAGTTLALTDAVVRGTRPRPNGTFGRGLVAAAGATVNATRVLLADNREGGAMAGDARSRLVLTDAVVHGTRPRADGTDGRGLQAQGGARLEAVRVLVADSHENGAAAVGVGTTLVLTDAVVRGTEPRPDGTFGHGVAAYSGARLEAVRVLVARNHAVGVYAHGASSALTVIDALVRGTRPRADGLLGRGLTAVAGAQLIAERVLVAENREAGATAFGAGTALVLTDTAVVATGSNLGETFGRGIEADARARLIADRVFVGDNRELGVMVLDAETMATLADVLIADVAPSARGFGGGAMAAGGAQLAIARLAATNVHGAALAAVPVGGARADRVTDARVTGVDLFVRTVRSSTVRFDDTSVTLRPTGRLVAYGLHAGAGCALVATQVVVADGGYGFFAAQDSTLAVHTGAIAGQLDAFGASTTDALTLEGIARNANANDAVVRDFDLPEAAALPTPTPVCVASSCP